MLAAATGAACWATTAAGGGSEAATAGGEMAGSVTRRSGTGNGRSSSREMRAWVATETSGPAGSMTGSRRQRRDCGGFPPPFSASSYWDGRTGRRLIADARPRGRAVAVRFAVTGQRPAASTPEPPPPPGIRGAPREMRIGGWMGWGLGFDFGLGEERLITRKISLAGAVAVRDYFRFGGVGEDVSE